MEQKYWIDDSGMLKVKSRGAAAGAYCCCNKNPDDVCSVTCAAFELYASCENGLRAHLHCCGRTIRLDKCGGTAESDEPWCWAGPGKMNEEEAVKAWNQVMEQFSREKEAMS